MISLFIFCWISHFLIWSSASMWSLMSRLFEIFIYCFYFFCILCCYLSHFFLFFFAPGVFGDGGWVLLTGVAFSSFLNIHHMEFHVSFWVNFTYENIHTLFPLPDLTDSQLVWSWIPRVNERQPISITRGLHGISAEKCTWTSTQTDYNKMIFPGESFIIRW